MLNSVRLFVCPSVREQGTANLSCFSSFVSSFSLNDTKYDESDNQTKATRNLHLLNVPFTIAHQPARDKIQLNLIKVTGSKKLGRQQQVTELSSSMSIFVQFKIQKFQNKI